jgi:hypothetical protein
MRSPDEGTCASEADFSTAGVDAVRARRIRVKPCSSTRYEAIEDLPAQMPGWCQEREIVIYWGLASAQSNKHGSIRTKETTEWVFSGSAVVRTGDASC